jgi:hypothetical protein
MVHVVMLTDGIRKLHTVFKELPINKQSISTCTEAEKKELSLKIQKYIHSGTSND